MAFELMWEVAQTGYFVVADQFPEYTKHLHELTGVTFSKVVAEFKALDQRTYFDASEWNVIDKALFEWVLKNPSNADGINKNIRDTGNAFLKLQDELLIGKSFSKLSNAQLAQKYAKFKDAMQASHNSGQVWNVLEMKNQLLSNYLAQIVNSRIADAKQSAKANQLLVTPTEAGISEKLNEELLELINKGDDSAVKSFYEKYAWVTYAYLGPAMTRAQFSEHADGLKKT
ncbi:hypothetical protein HY993_04500 [Candidatus Micrarchaeota archaeon]|nr:hypothetical protein [Candidatus Micrarchaeota archaeon]